MSTRNVIRKVSPEQEQEQQQQQEEEQQEQLTNFQTAMLAVIKWDSVLIAFLT